MPRLRSASAIFALGLIGLVAASSAEAAPCEFATQGADLTWVTVSPTGAEDFRLELDKRPLKARPKADGSSHLMVEAPLRFAATLRTSQLGARFEKRTSIAGGRIIVARGLVPGFPQVEAEEFKASTEAGEIPVHLPLVGLRIDKPLSLPCAALDISHHRDTFQRPAIELPSASVRHVDTREPIELYERRERVDPLKIRFNAALLVVAERDQWVKLRATWDDGSILQGWVPKSQLKLRRGVPENRLSTLGGLEGFGLCGGGHRRATTKFKIHSHAPIHESAAGEIWAHTAGTITVEAFPLARPDGWIQIAKVEGLPVQSCSVHSRIWVHAKHILWTRGVAKK